MSLFNFLPASKETSKGTNKKNKVPRRALSNLKYQQLEERRVLDASFSFDSVASLLIIDGFDNVNSELTIDQNSASINGGTPEDAYIFTLSGGNFNNGGGFTGAQLAADVQVAGNTLTIATNFFGAGAHVSIDGGFNLTDLSQTNIANVIDFNSLEVSNFQNGSGLALNVAGDVLIDATGDLEVTSITAFGDVEIETTGDIGIGSVSASGDALLAADGNVTLEEAVSVGGNLILDVWGDVSQLSGGTISAAGLGLLVDGETVLNEANDVGVIAADNNSATQFNDINDLKIGDVFARSRSVVGLTSSNDDVKFSVGSNLTVEEAIDLGRGDLFLDVNGDVSQVADGTISAAGLGLLVDGETVLVEANDVDVIAADNNGATRFNDINDLKIGGVTAEAVSADRAMAAMNGVAAAAEMSVEGIITSNDDFAINAVGNVNLMAPVTLGDGDFLVDSGADITTGIVQAENVSLNAGDDVRDALFGDGEFISAQNLSVVAFDATDDGVSDGVVIETEVDNLSVEVGDTGRVLVREADDITLDSIRSSGRVFVDAGGDINAQFINVVDAEDGNDVRLVSDGQIEVTSLTATGSDVFLVAEDDVLSAVAAPPIAGDRLLVRASNSIDDGGNDGIIIVTDVQSLNAIVPNFTNAGVISVDEVSDVVVEAAINQNGTVAINTNGNLTAELVFVRGATATNSIVLSASGVGSDIATGRLVVAQRVGGIALTADDDIRHISTTAGVSNEIVANELSLSAGNNFQDPSFNGISVVGGRVRFLDAVVAGADESTIFIRNEGALNVTNLSLQTGTIGVVNSNENLNVQNATIAAGNALSSISLRAEGGDSELRVGNVSARGTRGIFLFAADDIFDTSFTDDIFLDADRIVALSDNSSDDQLDGIFISANADEIFPQVPNGGEVFVVDRA